MTVASDGGMLVIDDPDPWMRALTLDLRARGPPLGQGTTTVFLLRTDTGPIVRPGGVPDAWLSGRKVTMLAPRANLPWGWFRSTAVSSVAPIARCRYQGKRLL